MVKYPIKTPEAFKFWASSNICNRISAICAFSLSKEDANKNLARYGYTNSFRKRVLESPMLDFNYPEMTGTAFNDGSIPTWEFFFP